MLCLIINCIFYMYHSQELSENIIIQNTICYLRFQILKVLIDWSTIKKALCFFNHHSCLFAFDFIMKYGCYIYCILYYTNDVKESNYFDENWVYWISINFSIIKNCTFIELQIVYRMPLQIPHSFIVTYKLIFNFQWIRENKT